MEREVRERWLWFDQTQRKIKSYTQSTISAGFSSIFLEYLWSQYLSVLFVLDWDTRRYVKITKTVIDLKHFETNFIGISVFFCHSPKLNCLVYFITFHR